MLFRRELAPGAAEQVAVMEQEQRRRQIEQQLALHQARSHMLVRPFTSKVLCTVYLLHTTHCNSQLPK
jgi:hypothetical protein